MFYPFQRRASEKKAAARRPAGAKPAKLVALYARGKLPEGANPVRVLQDQEIVDRLSCAFDVHVIETSGSYAELLDRIHPDVAIFEVNGIKSTPTILEGARDDRSVPKVLLIRSDAMCYTRPLVMQSVEDLGIDACFAVDSLYGHYFEELRDRLFYMPHSVDPLLFRDYRLPKTNVVTFFGHFLPSRPWRIDAATHLRRSFPCTFLPHDTSRANAATTRMQHGEAYARQIARSQFVPVEGGFHHGITRKFFEVPACRTGMLVPRIPGLAEYGFRDMVNCIAGEAAELRDKIEGVLAEPERYDALVDAGHALVREHHLHQHRTQLRDWLLAFRAAKPGEVVRQRGIFAGFETIAAPPGETVAAPIRSELPFDQFLIRRAERAIAERRLEDAESDLIRCMNLLHARHFLEPRFYLALVRLLQGRAAEAIYFLVGNYINRIEPRGGRRLDPREASYLIVAYHCLGDAEKAAAVARLFRGMRHREMRWALQLAGVRAGREADHLRSLFSRARLKNAAAWDAFVADAVHAHRAVAPTSEPLPEDRSVAA